MKNKNIIITGALVALLGTTITSSALAFSFDKDAKLEIKNAIANKDFATFQEIAPERFQNISQETFDKLSEKHLHRKENHHTKIKMNSPMHENIKAALVAQDYNAFIAAHGEMSGTISQKITPENFADFIKMHELREAGNTEGAEAMAQELGLPMMHKHHKGKFMKKMKMEQNMNMLKSQKGGNE